jgi:S1-C subfamily serine protease
VFLSIMAVIVQVYTIMLRPILPCNFWSALALKILSAKSVKAFSAQNLKYATRAARRALNKPSKYDIVTFAPTAPEAAAATSTPAPTGVPATTDWKRAVVRIVAAGSFVEPSIGAQIQIGGGSGFIIDSSGIAVTNNHVVPSAGLLKVYIEGDDEPHDARLLGVSECSDLAVLQIEGEDFSTLPWYEGDVGVGVKVLAAGYPGGDTELSLTNGIVSRAKVNGDTEWASVESVFAHTAKILEGSSGGPLVTEDGQVIGVNYAGVNETDQNYAIGRDEARKIIETLRTKQDDGSIGINGVVVQGKMGDQEISGIWVRSVKSGSPADKARVKPGDLITTMETLPLGADGTMSIYCDFVRDRSTDTLSIQVLRFSGQTIRQLEGQINGRELAEEGQPIAVNPGPDAASTPAPQAAPPPASGDHLGMNRIGQDGNPTCVAVQILGIATDSWSVKANGIALPAAQFDSAGSASLCKLRASQELTFNIYDAQGGVVPGGEGVPARGGDVFEGTWQ